MPEAKQDFSARLIAWHEAHGRKDLPWQQQVSAYRVWVSEIMLQQTQVSTVVPYFERFMQRFPSIQALAEASLDEVLQTWSGMGYYARARNLHKAARLIQRQHQGCFPQALDQAQALPGIGRSTAGAILALVYHQPHPILDGNVKRVLTRHRLIQGWPGQAKVAARLWQIAQALMPAQSAATYTQAIMDLGALICTRRRPACGECPVRADCKASRAGLQEQLPAPKPRRPLPVRQITMLIASNPQGEILLQRRPPMGLWGGLLSFPEFEATAEAQQWCALKFGTQDAEFLSWTPLTHQFSHFRLHIHPLRIVIENPSKGVMEADGEVWYNVHSLQGGLAAPVKKLIQRLSSTEESKNYGSNAKVHEIGERS
jgi:A/G-specific adenine glycosylase